MSGGKFRGPKKSQGAMQTEALYNDCVDILKGNIEMLADSEKKFYDISKKLNSDPSEAIKTKAKDVMDLFVTTHDAIRANYDKFKNEYASKLETHPGLKDVDEGFEDLMERANKLQKRVLSSANDNGIVIRALARQESKMGPIV